MAVKWVDFKEIKKRVSITDVLRHYELLETLEEREDGSLRGPCPLHNGSGFSVSTEKNCWNCFSCKAGRNVLDFVQSMESVTVRDAALLLAEWFEIPTEKPGTQRTGSTGTPKARRGRKAQAKKPKAPEQEPHDEPQGRETQGEKPEATRQETTDEQAKGNENPPLSFSLKGLDPRHEELRELGILPETLEHFHAGYCARGMMVGRLALPIHSPAGQLVAYAGRSLNGSDGEPYKYPERFNRGLELYNLLRAEASADHDSFGLFVVADILDVFRLYEAGFENVVALMGSELSMEQERLLRRRGGGPTRRLTLLFGGQLAEAALLRLSPHLYVRVVRPGRQMVETVLEIFSRT